MPSSVSTRPVLDALRGRRQTRRLRLLVGLLVAVIFGFDVWLPVGVALGSLYIVPVLISVWDANRARTLALAALCSALAPLGAWVALGQAGWLDQRLALTAAEGGASRELLLLLVNSANALFAIWVTTGLGLMRIEMERELVESRELSAVALASINDAVITTDTTGRIVFINAVAEDLTGWERTDAVGRPLTDVLHLARPRVGPGQEEFAAALALGDVRELVRKDGERRLVERRRSPIRDPEGKERGQVLLLRDASERAAQERAVLELAFRDPLTGLSNRHALYERLELELAHARRDGRRLAVMFLDLDHFKSINDTLGHHVGDEILRRVGQRLRTGLRRADTVARLGGDEFTILVPGAGTPADALQVAQKVVELIAAPLPVEGSLLSVRASIGVALFPDHADHGSELLRCADAAMYAAKKRAGSEPALFESGMPLAPTRRAADRVTDAGPPAQVVAEAARDNREGTHTTSAPDGAREGRGVPDGPTYGNVESAATGDGLAADTLVPVPRRLTGVPGSWPRGGDGRAGDGIPVPPSTSATPARPAAGAESQGEPPIE